MYGIEFSSLECVKSKYLVYIEKQMFCLVFIEWIVLEYGSSDMSTGTEMTWIADGHGCKSFMK